MRRFPILKGATLLVVGAIPSSLSADDVNLKQDFSAQYKRMAAAFMKNDLQTTPGRTFQYWLTLQQMRQNMIWRRSAFNSLKKIDLKLTKLTVKRKQAIAIVHVRAEGIWLDKNGEIGAKGKSHRLDFEGESQDIWIKEAKGWRLMTTGTDSEKDKHLVDGKLLNPRAPQKR